MFWKYFLPASLSQILDGVLQATPQVVKNRDSLFELAVHETQRVFCDRLVTAQDRHLANDTIFEQLGNFGKVRWTRERVVEQPVVFGDFFDANVKDGKRTYQCARDERKLIKQVEVGICCSLVFLWWIIEQIESVQAFMPHFVTFL